MRASDAASRTRLTRPRLTNLSPLECFRVQAVRMPEPQLTDRRSRLLARRLPLSHVSEAPRAAVTGEALRASDAASSTRLTRPRLTNSSSLERFCVRMTQIPEPQLTDQRSILLARRLRRGPRSCPGDTTPKEDKRLDAKTAGPRRKPQPRGSGLMLFGMNKHDIRRAYLRTARLHSRTDMLPQASRESRRGSSDGAIPEVYILSHSHLTTDLSVSMTLG